MSQISMYSGVYEDIREYADLLDKVLIDLKGGNSSPDDPIRRKLADLLKSLLTSQTGDLSMRMVNFLLRGTREIDASELARIGELLESTQVDNSVIEPLERLAQSLEREQAVAMARMRMRG
jgi:hypothetical protein